MFMSKKKKAELDEAIKRHPAKGLKKLITVHTETGSVYEFDLEQNRVRRVNETGNFKAMRKDDQWLELVTVPTIVIGQPMGFALHGVAEEPDMVTFRTTSYVTKIEEV